MGENMVEFVRRRTRETARFGSEAEAAAHEAYRKAIRAGEDLRLSSPGEVMRHGAKLLREEAARAAAKVSNVSEQTRRQADKVLRRAGQNPTVRSAAVNTARTVGNAAGMARGGVHALEGLRDGAIFTARLMNPLDRAMSPQGESAQEQLGRATGNAARATTDYVKKGVAHPEGVLNDIKDVGRRWNRELNPDATPAAPTFTGELRRNFDIGQNQGEVLFDAASLVVGGPAAKAMKGLSRAANVGNEAKYLAQGFSPAAAKHLAKPYPASNMGHHFIPRSYTLPKILGGGFLPRSYSDGVFNKLAPPGISRGDFYELHYRVDPQYGGGTLLDEGWRGAELGLKRYGTAGRIWHGSPAPLKARVGGLSAAAGGGAHVLNEDDQGW